MTRRGRDMVSPQALARRLITVPAVLVGSVLLVLLSPVLGTVALLVDLIRRGGRWPSVRLLGFLVAYLGYEVAGLVTVAAKGEA